MLQYQNKIATIQGRFHPHPQVQGFQYQQLPPPTTKAFTTTFITMYLLILLLLLLVEIHLRLLLCHLRHCHHHHPMITTKICCTTKTFRKENEEEEREQKKKKKKNHNNPRHQDQHLYVFRMLRKMISWHGMVLIRYVTVWHAAALGGLCLGFLFVFYSIRDDASLSTCSRIGEVHHTPPPRSTQRCVTPAGILLLADYCFFLKT